MNIVRKNTTQIPAKLDYDEISKQSSISDFHTIDKISVYQLLNDEKERNESLKIQLQELQKQLTMLQKINEQKTPNDLEQLYEKVYQMEQEYITQKEENQKESERLIQENAELNDQLVKMKGNQARLQITIEGLTMDKDKMSRSMDEMQKAHALREQQLQEEVEQVTSYYNECLTQSHQLQRRIEQCLQLITTQEAQFNETENKLRSQITQLTQKGDDRRMKEFQNRIEQIDQIDSKLKSALQTLEAENQELRTKVANLERSNEQKDQKMKIILREAEASEVIQQRLTSIINQKQQQLDRMVEELTQLKGQKAANNVLIKQLEQRCEDLDSSDKKKGYSEMKKIINMMR